MCGIKIDEIKLQVALGFTCWFSIGWIYGRGLSEEENLGKEGGLFLMTRRDTSNVT